MFAILSPDKRQHSEKVLLNDCWFGALPFVAFELLLPFSVFQDAVKIMAKDLVRTRRYVKKFIMMRANIQAVSLKVQVRFSPHFWTVIIIILPWTNISQSIMQLSIVVLFMQVDGTLSLLDVDVALEAGRVSGKYINKV